MNWWPWGNRDKVVCKDGSIRFVYRNIDDALPLSINSKRTKTEAAIDAAAAKIKTKIARENQEKVERVLFQIDASNASTQTAVRAAYVVYSTSPCEKSEYFAEAVQRASLHQERMQRTHMILENLVQLVSHKSIPSNVQEQVSAKLTAILRDLGESKQLMIEEMQIVGQNNAEWQK